MSPRGARPRPVRPTGDGRLLDHLKFLGLSTVAENLSQELDRGLNEQLAASQVLERLMGLEVEATIARRHRSRMKDAQVPLGKTLANFDFDFQPSIDRSLVNELGTLRFMREHRNVILLGPPGVGKSHIAAGLAAAAVDSGQRVRFTSAVDMVAHLQRALAADDVSRVRRNFYVGPPLLVIDELGYLPLDAASGHWIFHVVSKREGKGSIIITSNRGFGDWGSIFGDPVVATAIVDRLLHNAVVINIRGNSYRMRAYHDLGDPKVEDSVTVADKRAAEMPQEARNDGTTTWETYPNGASSGKGGGAIVG